MPIMLTDERLSLTELRLLEAQVAAEPSDARGTLPFLKDGMLAVIRSAIAAEIELERRR
jgi:hypothetical protein